MESSYDRGAEDVGNIVALEHVNVTVPDPNQATTFYVTGLGLTRDPYLMTGPRNMWVNVGRSQFHLPTNKPQVLRGITGLVIPDRDSLLKRLGRVKKNLDGTAFDFHEDETFVETTCPWGNRIRCHEPSPLFGPVSLGMPYVEFDIAPGTAAGIARFYTDIMGCPAAVAEDDTGRHTRVRVGVGQNLVFRETDRALPEYDGHHVAIYVADFSGPYRRLLERGLIFEESNRWQYRFKEIVDPESGKHLFTIEHEVRSMTSPMFMRPLVNRDPNQNIMRYDPGHDAWNWGMAHDE
ncbi:MAG TPA: VOC family protein [Candidatus Binataceae bacterium]|nr:VOC family protein [Candidatus Binataceae bacterium]